MTLPETFLLTENDWVPNNPSSPILVYRDLASGDREDLARHVETRFAHHGWPPQWRDTIYDYHHYHSTAHEALGIAAGTTTLTLGGPGGRVVAVAAGDVLVLPVGTGHCRTAASADFLVVGAYPEGQDWDICREAPSPEARERIATFPAPACDPVTGASLTDRWPAIAEPDPSRGRASP